MSNLSLEQIKTRNSMFFSSMALAFHKDKGYELRVEDGVQILRITQEGNRKVEYYVDKNGLLKYKSS